MPQINNFPGGFAAGVTIRGVPVAMTHPGKVFWVAKAGTVGGVSILSDRQITSSDNNKGTFDAPFATLTGALAQCVDHRGDIIFMKPGHLETITAAAGVVLNKAGVAIIGLGTGSTRASFNYTTANTASVTVAAANITLSNILFVGNFLNIAAALDNLDTVVATDFTVDNCEFRDASVILNFVKCIRTGTTSGQATGLTVTNCKVNGLATTPAAGTTMISLGAITDRLTVVGNVVIYRDALDDTATLIASGANDMTHAYIANNHTFRPSTTTTGALITTSSTACSGLVEWNTAWHLDNSGGLLIPVSTKFGFHENFCMITGAADKSGLHNPVQV